ncbi:MAG: hypothetical protein V1646_02975 [bacterium]
MSNFARSILFVIFSTSISSAFSMGKLDDFFSLGKLSLQKASGIATENFVSGVCDFADTFRSIPVDLHQDFIEEIGKYSISCLKKVFDVCPVSERYHSEYVDNILFTVFSRNSKLLLQLILCTQGSCSLSIAKNVDGKLLVEFRWTVDEQYSKFLLDSTFHPDALWNTIPLNFLICILRIAREN